MTGCLNLFKATQVNSPLAIFIPLTCIILLGVYKELVSEIKRYREDVKTNNTPVTRLLPQKDEDYKSTTEFQFEQTTLENVAVGDIIKVHDGEQVPADCVLLKVKDNAKECFVKTAALDGERNLKPKLVNEEFIANIPQILDPVDNH